MPAKKPSSRDTKPKEPITKSLPETLKYKVMAHQERLNVEDQRIRQQVNLELQQVFRKRFNQAARNDPSWLKAKELRDGSVNEMVDQLTPELPSGYAIVAVDHKEGVLTAIYDPQRRGQHIA